MYLPIFYLPVYLTNYEVSESFFKENPEINNTSHTFYGTQKCQESNSGNPILLLQELKKYIYKRVQVFSFSSVSVPKEVNVFLFSPTRATFTAQHIHIFAVQFKTSGYLLRCFLPTLSPNYTHTYSSVLIHIYV